MLYTGDEKTRAMHNCLNPTNHFYLQRENAYGIFALLPPVRRTRVDFSEPTLSNRFLEYAIVKYRVPP
jgi:hypothetical protein